jgi:ribosomal protein L7/L12
MNTYSPAQVDPAKVVEIAALLHDGANLDGVIRRMRALGLNKIDSIKMLRDHAGVPLGRAKDIVHLSPAWADRYESDERLHDMAEQAFESVP